MIADVHGVVNCPETQVLRTEPRKNRGELPLLNYWPGVAVLRANRVAETGLPTLIQPEWPLMEAAE